MNYLLMKDN